MHRPRFVKSTSFSLLLVTGMFVVTAACGEALRILMPLSGCRDTPSDASGTIDGLWRVTTINGGPPLDWPIPGTSDRFHSGVIEFVTLDVDGGDADECDPDESSGTAVALYGIRKPDGSLESKRFIGRFEKTHRKGSVPDPLELSAAGRAVQGSVSYLNFNFDAMTLTAAHDLFGGATVVLRYVP